MTRSEGNATATGAESIWQIAVRAVAPSHDAAGSRLLADLRRAGFGEIVALRSERLYLLRGRLDRAAAEVLAAGLFADAVTDAWRCTDHAAWPVSDAILVEVHLQPGVMDPEAMSACDAARELLEAEAVGGAVVEEVRTAWRYELSGVSDLGRVEAMCGQVFANACIERFFIRGLGRQDELPQGFPVAPKMPFERRTVALGTLGDDELKTLSRQGHLFLSLEEMRAIRDHFVELGREPTDLELETLAQAWSEHCVHKTLKSAVEYRGRGFGASSQSSAECEAHYDNLLRDTIARATHELNKPWCLSVFEDNAGIVDFDDLYGVAFKVETHNHPSAIEPYGGAATGAGGCIRDILGCGLGAKPVANTDVFCVARPDFEAGRIPPGVLRPLRVLRGIVGGVRDYGNRMGIPTVAGGLYFDDRYLANPLVFCGCVGVIPKDKIAKAPKVGDAIVVAGGRTGRDGIGGATFSSAELTDTHADEFAHAVQIGNAIEEKKVLDAQLLARDHRDGCLYSAVTDCGAGGLSSAVGEMACTLGATVDLEGVPLKYPGLRYNEIWLSEAQERMVFSVPQDRLATLLALFRSEDVEATVIGVFTGDGQLCVRYEGQEVGRLAVGFLHDGIPKRRRVARWTGPVPNPMGGTVADAVEQVDPGERLLDRLRSLNCCSREAIFRQYDQEVQGGSAVKALTGWGEGPSDAAVIRPVPGSYAGVAIGAGMCPQVGDEDPYWMAVLAIDEAVRNVVCVGADPERIAILDNFCWGGCEDDEQMGALVRACQACYDAAVAYGTPFISGKDSLNNQFSLSAEDAARLGLPEWIVIPATLLISALGRVDDVRRCVTADLKRAGDRLIHASIDVRLAGLAQAAELHRAVSRLVRGSLVTACHDVSDGGLGVSLAEMCIGGRKGADVALDPVRGAMSTVLFDESRCGYVLALRPETDWVARLDCGDVVELGRVTEDGVLRVRGGGKTIIEVSIDDLDAAWRGGLSLS